MPIGQDEDIRIYELPEAQELTAGMKVAVDSEESGTQCFDLSKFKPESEIYILKYSEVTNLDDVDLEKATTIPTFILIDSDQTLTIGNSTSSDTISINSGTIMRLEEVGGNDNGKPMFLTFVNDYGKSATGGTYMTYGNYFVRLVVSKSMYGGVSKKFGVSADIWSSNLFRSQQVPVVKKYDIARGPAESSGNLNGDANSLIVSFEDDGSNKRRQLLPPAELASHDFASDATPEQIQFMGWGATSNRAGYNNLITAQHNYDSTNFPIQTPQVQFLKFKMSGGTPESDQVMNVVQATMKSADGQNTEVIGGLLVPSITYAGAVLQAWTDSNGPHYGWKPVNEVPASTSQDEGKVLTVDSNGTPCWDIIFPVKNGYAIGGSESTVTVPNNASSTLSSSAESTLTLNVNVGPFEVPNFVVEISASSNITLTVTKTVNNTATTLKYSVAAGNTLEAGKYYQVTAVGNCWTLAEFANPS